ncbi:CusA/CzcA family heavy metal efflux RND transporter [Bradyrhizobium sp. ISRA443]|uniref:efflux RND transporter permease subunit n=1 Tax=unclassified Bradyrhizobium TaxID=2631580 RepID=UPI00247A77ED|nr:MULTISPECIES: CusA/CzcA family heavy metal efflux RND transporter [unclassified Bradyrhizobium]WGS02052.1 CusA/CzcA family heavy metal efflux RND transporter [Bradyrhizobium sp. ISRA436]WGS08937.1 CusA/CzcA family heavy metal efflux RND transporter [Bradyrhizobium sp. ISRA437]WGS15826.1 CusA/CzcA family heavy metal efflux RND transporter [Bradyrhizobium sp. ISRA443]
MIERIIALAIQRRWVVVTLAAILTLLGGVALTKLPIDAVPDITNKQVQINTTAPALSPAEIEKQITFPIETALAGAPGLESTRSLSRNGFSQITAVFSEATDIYFARQQVGERLTEVRARLPQGIEPRIGPTSTGLGEIYMWTVHFSGQPVQTDGTPGLQSDGRYLTSDGQYLRSEVEKDAYLRTVQDWIIKPQIKMVPGVAGVDSIGGYLKQYQVHPDAAKLIALGLTFADVAKAIEGNNVSRGARYIERNGEGFVVRSGGRLENIEELSAVVVTTRGGVPVRIRDIASLSIGGETRTGSASENGREVVIGTALMLIGANSRTVSAAVDARLRAIAPSLPAGIEVKPVLDRTQLVDATIGTVARNLTEGALLVIAVLFVLLGNFRAALITALVIPIAMLMTAIGMWQGRISANLMSLGALDFGLIVDGAVIITENSLRHLAEKQQALGRVLTRDERLATVSASAVEMVQPSLYGQAIILLVYVPLLTFTGVEGKMFEPMALTVILALAAAFVLSLTLVPALIAIAITGRVQEKENRLVAALKSWYSPLLRRAVAAPAPVIAVAVVLFAAALLGFSRLGQEFIPSLDEKNIAMHALRIPSTALSQSQAMQLSVEKTVSRFPQVAYVFSKTGTAEVASDPMPPNASDTFIILKPRQRWPDPSMTKERLIEEISAAVGRLPGNVYEFTQPIQMRFNELLAGVRGDIAVKVFGDEFGPMQKAANEVAAALRTVRGATDVKVEQAGGLPVLEIKVDKAAIARRGLSASAVQDVIGAAVGGQDAGVVYEGDRSFDIVVRLPESVRSDLEALGNLPVALPQATPNTPVQSLPLNRVARFSFTEGPNQISRENGKRRIVVTANVRGRDLGSVVEETQAKVTQSVKLLPGYWMTWGGQSENLAAARQRLAIVVPACFAMIFLLLLAAMGSARDALLVFSAVPLALTGGIAALWLRGMPFSISAAVGFIALSGVAVLNGLVMLSFVRQSRERGVPMGTAIEQGALTRFRPVVMTALVASLGFVPMAFATGTGAEVQKPLATIVIGGLVSATLLTLAVLPALYARYGHAGNVARKERTAAQSAE